MYGQVFQMRHKNSGLSLLCTTKMESSEVSVYPRTQGGLGSGKHLEIHTVFASK